MSDTEDALFGGTQPVHPSRRFDEAALARFCADNVPGFSGDLQVAEFKGGQSNPTYLLAAGGKHYVMRRKPPGEKTKSAHAVDREFKVMRALADSDVPVPKVHALCTDDALIGSMFYVMDHVEGRIFWANDMPGSNPDERGAVYASMIDTLARLHAVDFRAVGLEDFGKPTDFIVRQLKRFGGQYRDAPAEDKTPAMDRVLDWLDAHQPKEQPATIFHGDFKLGNLIVHPSRPQVIAVLDWELSTIGDPIADLAMHCIPYHIPADVIAGMGGLDYGALGLPTQEEHLAAYAKATGRADIPHWDYYMALMLFRLAVILLGILGRFRRGTAASDQAETMGRRASAYGDAALRLIQPS